MNLQLLYEFIVLAECLNFSEAAERLFTSQPVLSRHIAYLEQKTGAQLFIRNSRSVYLTPVGELMLDRSRDLLSRYEDMLSHVKLASNGMYGSLKVGYLDAAVRGILAPAATHFMARHPNIQLQVLSFDFAHPLVNALGCDKIDVALTLDLKDSDLGLPMNIYTRALYTDQMCVVLRSDHPLAGEQTVKLSQICEEPLIIHAQDYNPEGVRFVLSLFRDVGLKPNIVQRSTHTETALTLVEIGVGMTVLPKHLEVLSTAGVRFVPINGENASIDIILAWKESNPNPAIAPFAEEIEKSRLTRK